MAKQRPRPPLQLGPWLRRLNRKQVDVAKAIGISEPYMSQLINDPLKKVPSVNTLMDLAHELGFENPADLYIPPPPMDLSPKELVAVSKLRQSKNK